MHKLFVAPLMAEKIKERVTDEETVICFAGQSAEDRPDGEVVVDFWGFHFCSFGVDGGRLRWVSNDTLSSALDWKRVSSHQITKILYFLHFYNVRWFISNF